MDSIPYRLVIEALSCEWFGAKMERGPSLPSASMLARVFDSPLVARLLGVSRTRGPSLLSLSHMSTSARQVDCLLRTIGTSHNVATTSVSLPSLPRSTLASPDNSSPTSSQTPSPSSPCVQLAGSIATPRDLLL